MASVPLQLLVQSLLKCPQFCDSIDLRKKIALNKIYGTTLYPCVQGQSVFHAISHDSFIHIFLVGGLNPSEKYERQLG